jgi:hypothetical protein
LPENDLKKLAALSAILLGLLMLLFTGISCPFPKAPAAEDVIGAWVVSDASYDALPNQYINDYTLYLISKDDMKIGYLSPLSGGNYYWSQIYSSYISNDASPVSYKFSITDNIIKYNINPNPTLGQYIQWRFVFDDTDMARVYFGNNFSGTFTENSTPFYFLKITDYIGKGKLVKAATPKDIWETNDIKTDAKTIIPFDVKTPLDATFHDGTDDDWFSFAGEAGKTYVILTEFYGDRTYGFCDDTVVELYDNVPALITSSDDISSDNKFSKITWLCGVTATYFIKIYPKAHSDSFIGRYRFSATW